MVAEERVLDNGFVRLMEYMGSDSKIVQMARMSTGSESKDLKLVSTLYKEKHLVPFEHVVFTFHVKAPIFVLRQWMRARTQVFSEVSRRYTNFTLFQDDFYFPSHFTKEREDDFIDTERIEEFTKKTDISDTVYMVNSKYQELISEGVKREQARIILPLNQYSEMYMTVNLRNLFFFLETRLDPSAQYEMREYVASILKILESLEDIKYSVNVFKEMRKINTKVKKLVKITDYESLNDTLDILIDNSQGGRNDRNRG